jgi:hypothetical protein
MQISGLLEEHIHIHQKTGATVQTTNPSKDKVKREEADLKIASENYSFLGLFGL